jgi:hypothetical protein
MGAVIRSPLLTFLLLLLTFLEHKYGLTGLNFSPLHEGGD